ncbi:MULTISPECIES: hypothetical protein [unclassified Streptomyces]|nr:hypothetical protein [Streptomyces sp. TSRI0107]
MSTDPGPLSADLAYVSVDERTNYLEFVNALHRGDQEQAADLL